VLTGSLLDSRRVALTLGLPPTLSDLELVKVLRDRLKSAGENIDEYAPRYVKDAPLLEDTLKDVDLFKFPAPKWFAYDGGR